MNDDDDDDDHDAGDAGDDARARWYEVAIAWGCFLAAAGVFVGCVVVARACSKLGLFNGR